MARHRHLRRMLETRYRQYNRRRYVDPDPLAFLYRYPDVRDREIAALIAAVLAYGRVRQIMNSVERVLRPMASSPRQFVRHASPAGLKVTFDGFCHRFAGASHLAALILGIRSVIDTHGSLETCFTAGLLPDHDDVMPALSGFVSALRAGAGHRPGHLLPEPAKGSACKRLHLFLRWMVRQDDVDPGGWSGVAPAKLIVPLDVHMFAIGTHLGFTRRKTPDGKAARDVTRGFKTVCPTDPVRYDFCLTRFGIRSELSLPAFLAGLKAAGGSAESP